MGGFEEEEGILKSKFCEEGSQLRIGLDR